MALGPALRLMHEWSRLSLAQPHSTTIALWDDSQPDSSLQEMHRMPTSDLCSGIQKSTTQTVSGAVLCKCECSALSLNLYACSVPPEL